MMWERPEGRDRGAEAPSHVGVLPAQAHRVSEGVSQGKHWPGCGKNDHCEKNKLGGNTGPLALCIAFAQKAKRAQAQRVIRIKQPTVPGIAA